MSVFLSLVATVSAPNLEALSNIVLPEYLEWTARSTTSAAASVSFWVGPDGRIYDCDTLDWIGNRRLAYRVCTFIEGKRVPPARTLDGQATYGYVQTVVKLWTSGTESATEVEAAGQMPDLSLELNQLPTGLISPHAMEVVVEVDFAGQAGACNGGKDAERTLADLVCERASELSFSPGTDSKGNPVSYVRSLRVEFATVAAQ
ncbi:MAG: hypothetical protein AB3N06_08550 [Erythrobacter sp.]